MLLGFRSSAVGGEAVGDYHFCFIGHHIACYASGCRYCLHGFVEFAAVYYWLAGLVVPQRRQQRRQAVHCVFSHPRSRSMGTLARHLYARTQNALASCFYDSICRFAQDGGIAFQQVGADSLQLQQTAVLAGDFLTGVEDIGHIYGRLRDLTGEHQINGQRAFHIGCACAPEDVAVSSQADIAVWTAGRHGV